MRLRSVLFCAALLCSQAALHAAPKVPLAAFVHEDQFSNPSLAPDGKHIAITARIPSGDRFIPVVMIHSLPDMKMVGAIRMPVFEVPASYTWVSNTRLAISKGRELGSREAPVATGEILAVEIDGTKQEYLFGYKMYYESRKGTRYGNDESVGYVEDTPRERNGRFFLTSHPWEGRRSFLFDVDSRSGTRNMLADVAAPDLGFVIQNNGKPRFAYGSGDDSLAVLYQHNDAADKWTKLEKNLGRRYVPFAFSPDDTEFLVRSSPDGGPDKLIKENLATAARVTLFEHPHASFTGLLRGAGKKLPFGAMASIGKPMVRYFNSGDDDAKLHKLLSQQFPEHHVTFINFSDDGNLVLLGVASDRDPGSFYLFNKTTMKADLLFSAMDAIDPDQMAERRPIAFKARDGLDLYGFMTMPAKASGALLPLIVLPHGGPHGVSDNWFFDDDAQFLASRGYAVLQVNFRGSDGRGVDFQEAGHRQWGSKIQDDLVDGVKWAIAQGEVDARRVCAYGASFGGYSALMLAAREPALIKCAVGYAGIYDLSLLSKPENSRHDQYMASYFARVVGTDKAELAQFSPVTLADKIKAPVLLIHGGNDKKAPVAHAEAMRAALIKAGRAPEWMLAPNEGHGFYDTKNRTEFYTKLEAFLARHIGQ